MFWQITNHEVNTLIRPSDKCVINGSPDVRLKKICVPKNRCTMKSLVLVACSLVGLNCNSSKPQPFT